MKYNCENDLIFLFHYYNIGINNFQFMTTYLNFKEESLYKKPRMYYSRKGSSKRQLSVWLILHGQII